MKSGALKILFGCAAVGILQVATASAALLLSDNFNYTGALTANGWTAHSGGGSKVINSDGAQATVVQSAGSGEDINRNTGFAMGAGSKWYAGFDVTVTGTAATVAAPVYFAHFQEGTSIFQGRVFVTSPVGAAGYRFGLSNSSTISSTWASDFAFGGKHRVVVAYDYTSGIADLWVDPVNEASTSITAPFTASDEITSFALRQNTGGDSSQIIDNLFVATSFSRAFTGVPEPASLTLFALAGMTLAVAGRRTRR